jgi:hypothetical protein
VSAARIARATPERSLPRARFLLLAAGGLALLAGLTGALVLLGVGMPSGSARFAPVHGELMTLGFLGTVVALERAVALGRPWGYLSPALSAVGAIGLIAAAPALGAAGLLGGAALLLAVYAAFARVERSLQLAVQAAGAGAWLGASFLLAAGVPVMSAYPWLAAFLVMTVVGERLDLARLGGLATRTRRQLIVVLWLFVIAVSAAVVAPEAGTRVAGLAMLAMAAWLARHDLARRTVRMAGVTRYIAVCLLAGYAWLAVAGGAWALTGTAPGPAYDIRLHALFLGFIVSMVFGHAPVIVPAVLRVPLPYRPWHYGALVLLHAGLVIRLLGGDVLGMADGLLVGGTVNVAAMLAFVVGSMASSLAELRRRHALEARRAAASPA